MVKLADIDERRPGRMADDEEYVYDLKDLPSWTMFEYGYAESPEELDSDFSALLAKIDERQPYDIDWSDRRFHSARIAAHAKGSTRYLVIKDVFGADLEIRAPLSFDTAIDRVSRRTFERLRRNPELNWFYHSTNLHTFASLYDPRDENDRELLAEGCLDILRSETSRLYKVRLERKRITHRSIVSQEGNMQLEVSNPGNYDEQYGEFAQAVFNTDRIIGGDVIDSFSDRIARHFPGDLDLLDDIQLNLDSYRGKVTYQPFTDSRSLPICLRAFTMHASLEYDYNRGSPDRTWGCWTTLTKSSTGQTDIVVRGSDMRDEPSNFSVSIQCLHIF